MLRKILCILVAITMMTAMIPVSANVIQNSNLDEPTTPPPPEPPTPSLPPASEFGNQTIDVGIPVEENPELFSRSMPTHGEGKIAVFLIDFPDYRNENPVASVEYYDGLYFSGGVLTNWGDASGNVTVSSFFREASYGKLNLSGKVFDWYTTKYERSYYDFRKGELIKEAAEYYRSQGVDFSQFDADQDGVLDSVVFHFAGESSEDNDSPWNSGVALKTPLFGTIEQTKITTIVQIAEGASAGKTKMIETICHELFHVLGMPDLYGDTYWGLVPTNDLMSNSNPRINPYLKMLLGWIDTAQVITTNAENITLGIFEKVGDVAIVTDTYNGLFDEFYLVAYSELFNQADVSIWHVDARLTADGQKFLFDNYIYDPRPDKPNSHRGDELSQYLFIEELSGNQKYNFIFNIAASPKDMVFTEESVLGPNSMPSSDTHDGRYTGIRIDGFTEHNETYSEFDVSIVEDTAAPAVVTQQKELEFKQVVTISFNEHIYQGQNWNQIQVTDLTGKQLSATVIRPHYPCNVLEITFADEAYRDGYKLILPEDSVRDSSGNGVQAVVLTASNEQYLYPMGQTQLPGVAECIRDNSGAYFFRDDESFVVITSLWDENGIYGNAIEFMRLDYAGNVLTQSIVKNPFPNSYITYVNETGNGCYIFMCKESLTSLYDNLLFCIDQNGQLKWSNGDYKAEGNSFLGHDTIKYGTGLITTFRSGYPISKYEIVYINAENGQVESFETRLGDELFKHGVFEIGNGKILRQTQEYNEQGNTLILEIIDTKTFKVIKKGKIETASNETGYIKQVIPNSNGTLIVCCSVGEHVDAFLLDADMKVTKSVRIRAGSSIPRHSVIPMGDDGFCEVDRTATSSHEHSQYHIRRYDRNLNFMWETAVAANFIYYFKSPTGEVLAYQSMLKPERECYILNYGMEPTAPTITSDIFTVSDQYVSKIAIGTTVGQLLNGIHEASSVKVLRNGTELSGDAIVGTGMSIQLYKNRQVVAQFEIVVTGDTNGDGKLTVTDFVQMQAHLLNKTPLKGAAAKAADTSGDGKISVTDYVQMQAHILGKSNVQPKSA